MKHTRLDDQVIGSVQSKKPDFSDWLGHWTNTNPETRSISHVILEEIEGELWLQAFGVCEPTPCDWGKAKAHIFTSSVDAPEPLGFTAKYDFSFMETAFAGNVKKGILVIQEFNSFKDGSGRQDYYLREFFCK